MPVKMLPVEISQWPEHLIPPRGLGRGSAAYKAARACAPSRTPIRMTAPTPVNKLIAEMARKYEVTKASILGGSQFYPLPQARAELAVVLRDRGYSLTRIGAIIGKHHTSVLDMIRRFNGNTVKEAAFVFEPDYVDESGIWAI